VRRPKKDGKRNDYHDACEQEKSALAWHRITNE
jgi:hypothetical protein